MHAMYVKSIKMQAGDKWPQIESGAIAHQEACKDSRFDSVDFLIMEFNKVMGFYP